MQEFISGKVRLVRGVIAGLFWAYLTLCGLTCTARVVAPGMFDSYPPPSPESKWYQEAALTVMTAGAAAIGILAGVRVVRRPEELPTGNICRKCGYDLTGNVSGVCPECGEQI